MPAFTDRKDASKRLASKVNEFLRLNPFIKETSEFEVVGLSMGGAEVALEVARLLDRPLGMVVTEKIPFPGRTDCHIGAVTSDGAVVVNPEIPQTEQWRQYLQAQIERLAALARFRQEQLHTDAEIDPPSLDDKVVVLVDDGVVSGMTALASIETAKKRGARFIILAVPVVSENGFSALKDHCDEVLTVELAREVRSVDEHYAEYRQTSHDSVAGVLASASGREAGQLGVA